MRFPFSVDSNSGDPRRRPQDNSNKLRSTLVACNFALALACGSGRTETSAAAPDAASPPFDAALNDATTAADMGASDADPRLGPGDGSQTVEGAAACLGSLVCDDFEHYPVGAPPSSPWSVAKSGGSVLVDSTRSHSGSQSVKVTAPAAPGYRSVFLRLTGGLLPVTGNAIYGRMMFWLDSAPSTQVHWTFIDGSGPISGTAYHSVYRYGGQKPLTSPDGGFAGNQLMASYDTPDSYSGMGPGSDCYKHSTGRPVPVAIWTCAEWQFDGASNTMRFWLNGAPAPDLTVMATGDGCTQQPTGYPWTAPSFQQLDVGWESYQADDARTIWIDDLAFGTVRMGCP